MIERDLNSRLRDLAESFPAVMLTGPRQSGKSTLCRSLFPDHGYVNLESPDVRAFAQEDPRGFLGQFEGSAIIDEVQRVPELLSYLQPLIDENPVAGRWVLTGSQNLLLLESVSQSLAGRVGIAHLLPLAYSEVRRFARAPESLDDVLFTGGYPRIYDESLDPSAWLSAYIATYVERDVRTISNIGDLTAFQRLLELCAGRTGQLLNYSQLASDCGISQPTAKSWLSVLETSFVVFRLPAYTANVRKRVVKMPKLHFYDTGLVCWLLGIRSAEQLRTHPLKGAVFESWVVSEIIKHRTNAGERGGVFFYRDQHGVEADAIVETRAGALVVEAKAGQTVASDMAGSARRVRDALELASSSEPMVVYGGAESQRRSGARLLAWTDLERVQWW